MGITSAQHRVWLNKRASPEYQSSLCCRAPNPRQLGGNLDVYVIRKEMS